ncbi:CapA family protein [Ensifer sp. IC3342]|nr:CapA family protein [Ensifer sp. BRP08]MCA1451140.1 CapA family protein [Ensifer sp. IC3342]
MSTPFTLALTGQSLIHHDVRHVMDEGFVALKRLIRKADISLTNFEMTVLGRHGGWPLKGSNFDCAPADVLNSLQDIGFTALALSNNHAFDLGPSGVLSTLEEVEARGFLHAGTGVDATDARHAGEKQIGARNVALVAMDAGPGPDVMYADNATAIRPPRPGVNKLDVRRSFDVEQKYFDTLTAIQETFGSNRMELANYAQPNDPPELASSDEIDFYGTIFRKASSNSRRIVVDEASLQGHLATIRKAASDDTFVIAYLHHHHWEPSWSEVPGWVQAVARSCVDAGANAFVSHGVPVLQPIEIYRGAPIFFGLGNFLFHLHEGEVGWSSPDIWKSMVATCSFDGNGRLQSIDFVPIVIGGEHRLTGTDYHERNVPMIASHELGRAMLEELGRRSQKHGTKIVAQDARIYC